MRDSNAFRQFLADSSLDHSRRGREVDEAGVVVGGVGSSLGIGSLPAEVSLGLVLGS